jgi:hypothetical protein
MYIAEQDKTVAAEYCRWTGKRLRTRCSGKGKTEYYTSSRQGKEYLLITKGRLRKVIIPEEYYR